MGSIPSIDNMQAPNLGWALKGNVFFCLFLPLYALGLFPFVGEPENEGVI